MRLPQVARAAGEGGCAKVSYYNEHKNATVKYAFFMNYGKLFPWISTNYYILGTNYHILLLVETKSSNLSLNIRDFFR